MMNDKARVVEVAVNVKMVLGSGTTIYCSTPVRYEGPLPKEGEVGALMEQLKKLFGDKIIYTKEK